MKNDYNNLLAELKLFWYVNIIIKIFDKIN
jgi:hypothetical protein